MRRWNAGAIALTVLMAAAPGFAQRYAYTPDQLGFYQQVKPRVQAVRAAFRDRDAAALVQQLPPGEGLTFRYLGSYITEISRRELAQTFTRPRRRWWGREDGTGRPIVATFRDRGWPRLRARLLDYDLVGVEEFVNPGNAIDRRMAGARFVDLASVGTPRFNFMDWESVRLFFVRRGGRWYLKGIDLYHWTT